MIVQLPFTVLISTCHIFCKAMVSMYFNDVECHIVKFRDSNEF